MKLYDNDAYRDDFIELVYGSLHSDGNNDRANQIIDAFDRIPAVDADMIQPNNPLTLEELREMDGEPVFITIGKEPCIELGFWTLVEVCGDTDRVWLTNNLGGRTGYDSDEELNSDDIQVYRRKPEEETT